MKAHNVSLGLKIKVNNMALIKIKQIEGLSSTIGNVDSSINSLEGIATDISGDVTTNAGDIDSLEGSVNSLEGIATDIQADVTTNATGIGENATVITELNNSVNSLETVVSAKLEASDLGDLEASVNSLEGIANDHANSISGLETSISDIFSIELPQRDASISSLETVVSTKLEAADLGDLEASVDSLETVTTTNATGIGENSTAIVDLVVSVNSLENLTSTKASGISTNAADIDSLEGSVNSLEGIATGLANDIAGLVAREAYGAEDVSGLTAGAGVLLNVPFTPGRFGAYPYDYEVYVNGVKTVQAWVTTEFDGTSVELTLPYDVVETDVFTIKAIEFIP